jgi:hypothetical protein
MSLIEALRRQTPDVKNGYEKAKSFAQRGDRGAFREAVIQDFLRPFLPPRFGLGTGEVFAHDGNQSNQMDVVIFDAIFSTVLFRNGPVSLFPAESVYGSIEVKSNLTTAELESACANAASLRQLIRDPTTNLDFLPDVKLELGPGLAGGGGWLNPYICTVFGYTGASEATILARLNELVMLKPEEKKGLPNFVFVADPGYMILRVDASSKVVAPDIDFVRFRSVTSGEDTLVLMFLTLNEVLSHIRLRRRPCLDQWQQLTNEMIAKAAGIRTSPLPSTQIRPRPQS